MQFEWDEKKNQKNMRKHGVMFEEVETIWTDLYALEKYDLLHSVGEERFLRIGYSSKGRLIIAIFCQDREQMIRIISARKVTKKERHEYEKRV